MNKNIFHCFKRFLSRGLAASLAISALAAHATTPTQLTIVVPFAAGGPTDGIAHAFAEAARRHSPGRTIVVENVGGAGGALGAAKVARSPADGSVLLLQNIAMSVAPATNPDLSFDPLNDFEYLGMLEEVPMTLVGGPALPDTFAALQRWVHDKQGTATLAHAGVGSASYLCGMLLQNAFQPMALKTYTGNAPATADVIAGRVDLLCDASTSATRQIETGKVRAFGVTASTRIDTAALRAVPTFAELGLKGADMAVWFALCAPRGTPEPVVSELNALLRAVVADPAFVQGQEASGAIVIKDDRLSPVAHKDFVASEIQHWGSVIRAISSNE